MPPAICPPNRRRTAETPRLSGVHVSAGPVRGLGEAKDVALKDLIANPNVFVKNELTISGQVRVDGYVNVNIPVRLLFETAPGKMEIVAQQTIRATADGQILPVSFSYIPQTPGERRLTVEAAEQPGELVTTNNRMSTFVRVLKGGLNVLYLEGELRPEISRIRRALDSSPERQGRLCADRSQRPKNPSARFC